MIDKEECSMSYVKIDDAIRIILKLGRNSTLCKYDISDAFKICPYLPSQWPLFCFKWQSFYYYYVRLTFGCRSSPKIFDTVSQAICHIAEKNYKIKNILHLLDDFLTIDHPSEDGERSMAIMMTIFKRLNIPIAKHKTEGPVTCLEYLEACGYQAELYNGHSFRIGAATSAGKANVEDHLIKTLGRLSSDSYCRYIRTDKSSIKNAQQQICNS
ncbi:unnamed protein product [Mytilus edulis]|uniref:Reverse transcriptase domain-containing protein n=1 Tax=Mytilus edulis TaxID=6550 RepID=A0A8S3QLA2_MYTED|nr:unnamed protein product [Mytilus edulis]